MRKIVAELKDLVNREYAVFIWILALSILSFGILIPTLGFYWDDLPYLFQYSAFGPAGFPDYVASDRPFSAWIFSLTTAVFGYQPLYYHILILVLRALCASLFFLILREVWPSRKTENIIAASIFAIYPGFLQQPIALIYNHHFSVFAMFLASVYLMIVNLKREKPGLFLWVISILLAFSVFSIENFAMLELVRPFIIWKIASQKESIRGQRLRKTGLNWMPYFAVLVLFFIWRVLIFKFPTYKPAGVSGLIKTPLETLGGIFSRIPADFYTVFIRAWGVNLSFPTVSDFGRAATYLFWLVVAGTALTVLVYFLLLRADKEKIDKKAGVRGRFEYLFASILLFLLAGSIVWGLDLPLENKFAWDRMTLAFFPGIALFGAFLFSWFKTRRVISAVLLAVLLMLASSQNYQNGIAFKRDWDNLQDFLTQLSWRIPALAENTIFITSVSGLDYYSDNSLTSPINLQYADDLDDDRLSHFVYFTNARTEDWFEDDLFDQDYKKRYRSFIFYGNTGNAIAYRFEPPACVHVLDWKYANSVTTPNMTDRQVKEVRFTDLSLIRETPAHPPFSPLFKQSDTGTWCFYFEKADLARQFGKYAEVVRLGDQAISAGKAPRLPSEWLPFLEGYLWEGELDKAEMLVNEIIGAEGNYTAGMCYTLRRIRGETTFQYNSELDALISKYNCES